MLAAARFALGKLSSEEAIASASGALDRGLYSESLGRLLSTEPIWSKVRPLFEKGLSELTIPIPSRSVALQILAHEFARQMIFGELSPYEGSRRIWWDVANESDSDPSLRVFVGLASEWEDTPQYRLEYEDDMVAEARRMLGSQGSG